MLGAQVVALPLHLDPLPLPGFVRKDSIWGAILTIDNFIQEREPASI